MGEERGRAPASLRGSNQKEPHHRPPSPLQRCRAHVDLELQLGEAGRAVRRLGDGVAERRVGRHVGAVLKADDGVVVELALDFFCGVIGLLDLVVLDVGLGGGAPSNLLGAGGEGKGTKVSSGSEESRNGMRLGSETVTKLTPA